MRNTIKPVQFRRKRKGLTNYHKRLKLLMGDDPRFVIRRTVRNMVVQIVKYGDKGDEIVVTATSSELKKYGWEGSGKNIPAAYLTGILAAQKAKKKKINKAIVDIGLAPTIKGGKLFAAVAGAVDGGLEIPHGKEALPTKERITGEHISLHYKDVKGKGRQYNTYELKKPLNATIDEIKKKMMTQG